MVPGKKSKNKSHFSQSFGGALWMFSSSITQALLRLLFMLILARLLSPEDFGLVAIASTITGFAELCIELGISPALVQTAQLTDDHIYTGFTACVLSGIAMTIIFLILNPFIATFFKMPDLLWVLNTLVWIFPLRMISKISYSLLQREMQFKKLAGNEVISYLAGFGVIGLPMAYLGFGYKALVWATIVQTIVYSAILFYLQPHKIKLRVNINIWRELISYGRGSTISSIFTYFASQGDYLVVGKMTNAASLGFYTRAYKLMDMSNTMVGSIMNKVLFPSFSRLSREKQESAPLLKITYELVFMIFIPLGGISFILSPELIHVLLGNNWENVIPIFQMLSIGMVFRIAQKVGSSFSKGHKLIYKNAYIQIVYFLNVIIGAYIGTFWSLTTVALFINIAIFINFVLLTNLSVKHSAYKWSALIKDFFHHMLINFPLLFILWMYVDMARSQDLPDIITVTTTIFIWVVILLLMIKLKRNMILGDTTEWIENKFLYKIPILKKLLT